MSCGNHSRVTEFILIGLSSDPKMQMILFPFFLLIYMVTLSLNLLLISAVRIDHRLHSPMYFFLSSLSFLDICYTSITVPKMLVNFLALKKTISFIGCAVQIFFFLILAETECFLLAFMSYDRFVAICYPLRYNNIMNKISCVKMITTSWITGGVISMVDMFFIYRIKYNGPNIINHFFCEAPSLLELSCSDRSLNNIVTFVGCIIILFIPLSLTVLSYIYIISAIIRIHSGRYKAFSTCISHLIVVVLFYGTGIFMYMRPRHSVDTTDKIVSVFYTIVTPMLNPLIYSLRNKDVQNAVRGLGRYAALHSFK
ncbi:olfactory receptor 5A2-like [Discoglossus pictus]